MKSIFHLSFTSSLGWHLTKYLQLRQKSSSIMPIICKSVNEQPLKPLLWQCSHSSATQKEVHFMGPSLYSTASSQGLAPRSFPFIKGNGRGAEPWDEIHHLIWDQRNATTGVSLGPIMGHLNHANGLQICQWTATQLNQVKIQPLRCYFSLSALCRSDLKTIQWHDSG